MQQSRWLRRAPLSFLCGVSLFATPYLMSQDQENGDVFELSPFTVDGSEDAGYRATSTLAGTRIRTNLRDVGSAISVVTEEFLRDTNATDNQSLLIYTPNMEVGGDTGNFAGGGDSGRIDTDTQRRAPNDATRVRGLAKADNTRSFFATDIPWDSYNVKRIDLQRGPNSVLFGLGSPAGVINANVDQATFKNGGEAQVRFDDEGSWRATLNYNKVLIENELSVRLATLQENQKFKQSPAFENDDRYFVAFKYQPGFLQGDDSNGTLHASYEYGNITANRPRVIPMIDRITPWFDSMNRQTFDSRTVDDANGPLDQNGPNFEPYLGSAVGRIFDGPVAVFDNGTGTASSYYMAALKNSDPAPNGRIRGVESFDTFSQNANLAGSEIGAYKSITISDPSIYDFYETLLDGPNKNEWQDWEVYNVSYSHNWLNNRLGIELAYDEQIYEDGQSNILNNFGQSLSVDIMEFLPDGTANPNLGRPFIGGDSQTNNFRKHDRETFRATAYYELDFRDFASDSFGWLGRHVFTGLYSDQKLERLSADWIRNSSENVNTGSSITQADRYVASIAYLGPSLTSASSASGANIQGLNSVLVPTGGPILTDQGNQTLSVLSADSGQIGSLYKSANFADDTIESNAIVWQGFLFDGTVVPMFGYRDDTATARNAGDVPSNPDVNGAVLISDPDWTLPNGPSDLDNSNSSYDKVGGITRTYSLVLHTPAAWREHLPEGMDISLSYGESSNFRPDASRRDVFGNPVAPSEGETKEYGITISAMNGRLNFRANKYETQVFRDTLSDSSIANSYMIGAGEGWGRMFGLWAEGGLHDFRKNYALEDPDSPFDAATNPYINPNVTDLRYQPVLNADMTDAERAASIATRKAEQEASLAALFDPSNRPPSQIENFWMQDWDAIDPAAGWGSSGNAFNGTPATFAVTGDTESKGWEYELFYQPTENWNLAINASKTSAKRLNIGETYAQYVEERWELYQGPYGDVQLWNGNLGQETIRGKFGAEFYSNYLLFTLLNDSNVAELRPWRFNLISNYSFDEGKFAGLNVGGSLRWQDEIVVGYPVVGDGNGNNIFDVDNPYFGSSETNFDFWAGYSMELRDGIDWRIQLNVRNAFTSDELIPVTVQPDGSPATSRIAPPRSITLTNTFTF